jgi:rubrerythrin
MEKEYTSQDIIQMAVQAKERGTELYLTLARSSENYHVSRLFTELAKDENRHKLQLEKWLKKLDTGQKGEAYPGEKALYLKALVDAGTFNCGRVCKQALETTISEEEALQAGISFEKDVMLFLHELKSHVGDDAKKTVDTLIDEEMEHLHKIFRLKDKVQ